MYVGHINTHRIYTQLQCTSILGMYITFTLSGECPGINIIIGKEGAGVGLMI